MSSLNTKLDKFIEASIDADERQVSQWADTHWDTAQHSFILAKATVATMQVVRVASNNEIRAVRAAIAVAFAIGVEYGKNEALELMIKGDQG